MSCGAEPTSQYTYRPPEDIDDGLEVGTLEEVNIDSELIAEALDKILSGKYSEVHSLLIFKDNKLVLEEYFMGHRFKWDGPGHHGSLVKWNRDKPHTVMSAGKSVTSACIGLAIDQGFIDSVHQSIVMSSSQVRSFSQHLGEATGKELRVARAEPETLGRGMSRHKPVTLLSDAIRLALGLTNLCDISPL